MTSKPFEERPFEAAVGEHGEVDPVDQQVEYVLARLVSRGVSGATLDTNELRTLLNQGLQRALAESEGMPHPELTYRGALEVLVDRVAVALERSEPAESHVDYLGMRMAIVPADIRDWICPLWPFC